jgi:hypothetical protein
MPRRAISMPDDDGEQRGGEQRQPEIALQLVEKSVW